MKVLPVNQDAKTLSDEMNRPSLIPLVTTKEGCENPADFYLSLREKYDASYLLESLTGPREVSRYSIIGCQPLIHLKIQDECEVNGVPSVVRSSRERIEEKAGKVDELEILKSAMFMDDMRFLGLNLPRYVLGVTGYVSYDFIRSLIDFNSKSVARDDLHHPILEFMLPSLVVVFDHLEERPYYASLMLLTEDSDFDEAYSKSLGELEGLVSHELEPQEVDQRQASVSSNMGKEDFEEGVRRIKKYIRAGDVIQTVFSRRIGLDPAPSLSSFYTELRRINPSPYMFFLDFPELSVIGSSPEALVRVQGRKVLTRPIAGTRRRGRNEEDDLAMERDLLADEKERAEHVMLVDLGRNDIGRVAKFGSVEIPDFMKVEKYGDVQHIVSTVTGELQEDRDAFDALRAIFPAGTVTGAPKVRAMEIIEELEPTRRGIYSGAVGSFSYTGDADFAITIRTLTERDGMAQIQVGAGVVADSMPWKEHYETENKARSLLRAAGVEKC
ncbi:hypothetical protein AKJ43_03160 [candidate division MSBL1 archaeon SCGC-AAA261D19]|uniref:anthranilate synthase n=1 Tax=candidate division MSBL1 archaeon SCGC-AAA261D19 TaxID=1698273 RepID=A0A133V5I8_9EURY|nr:hypothetical protein AKJ43_03160 [candidate division MSBL1 archaeon SCGC-AAA261D19]